MTARIDVHRRQLLRLGLAAAPSMAVAGAARAQTPPAQTRRIPSTGEALPLVGLGSWITFNVGNDRVARDRSAEVIRAFLAAGGTLIDSSPMYGSSQDVIGEALREARHAEAALRGRQGLDRARRARARADRALP